MCSKPVDVWRAATEYALCARWDLLMLDAWPAVPCTLMRGHKCQIVHDSISSSFYCLRQQYGSHHESELPLLVSLMFCLIISKDVFNNVFILTVVAYYILTNTAVGACQCQHIKIYWTLLRSMTAMMLVPGKTALIMTKIVAKDYQCVS